MKKYDVIVVGGGPAGMNAALILGRCRRSVLMFDTGTQRNIKAEAMHGYLTRDGIPPSDFIQLGRSELRQYDVELVKNEIVSITKKKDVFTAQSAAGTKYEGRRILLATGLRDRIPQLQGIEELYGKSVHHCPICDGWQHRDGHIAIYGSGRGGYSLALSLLNWSSNVVLCTDGKPRLQAKQLQELEMLDIPVVTEKISRLEGSGGKLKYIHFDDGSRLKRSCLFFAGGYMEQSQIAKKLGCRYTTKNEIWVDRLQQSSVQGLYISGDATRDMKLVILAAAEGAKAGVAINLSLMEEERGLLMKIKEKEKAG
jgi:thioredoxin reductase